MLKQNYVLKPKLRAMGKQKPINKLRKTHTKPEQKYLISNKKLIILYIKRTKTINFIF